MTTRADEREEYEGNEREGRGGMRERGGRRSTSDRKRDEDGANERERKGDADSALGSPSPVEDESLTDLPVDSLYHVLGCFENLATTCSGYFAL